MCPPTAGRSAMGPVRVPGDLVELQLELIPSEDLSVDGDVGRADGLGKEVVLVYGAAPQRCAMRGATAVGGRGGARLKTLNLKAGSEGSTSMFWSSDWIVVCSCNQGRQSKGSAQGASTSTVTVISIWTVSLTGTRPQSFALRRRKKKYRYALSSPRKLVNYQPKRPTAACSSASQLPSPQTASWNRAGTIVWLIHCRKSLELVSNPVPPGPPALNMLPCPFVGNEPKMLVMIMLPRARTCEFEYDIIRAIYRLFTSIQPQKNLQLFVAAKLP